MTTTNQEKTNGKNKTKTPPQVQTQENHQGSKEVAHKGETSVAHRPVMAEQEVLNSDVVIPALLLMQGLSDFVADGKAQIGDIVRSTTGEKLGDDKHEIPFIPLQMINLWTVKEKVGQKFEWRGTEPRTAANADAPWDFVKNGTDWKRVQTINVVALLPNDIEAFRAEIAKGEDGVIDLEKTLLPVMISFQSTSFRAGKDVATFFTKVRSNLQYNKNVAPYKYMLSLGCERTENDKGKFCVFKVGPSKPLKTEFLDEAAKWYGILNTAKNIKVDVSGEEGSHERSAEVDVTKVDDF